MSDARKIRATVLPSFAVAALLALAPAAPAGAQAGTVGSWLPWAGCWEGLPPDAVGGEGVEGEVPEGMLCIRPADGVRTAELLTVVDGEIGYTRTLRADGRRQRVSRQGCEGWQTARFSEDGARVYLRTDLTCEGGVRRVASGIMAMVSPYEWIDVQAVEIGEGEASAWVQRYGFADEEPVEAAGLEEIVEDRAMAVESARMVAARAPGIDDVIDASEHVHPQAVKSWIAEQSDPFRIDAEGLTAMADAGVPRDVIDVVVAVSYPDRFAVDGEPREREEEYDRRYDDRRYGSYGHPRSRVWLGFHFGYPYYYGPYRYRSSFFHPYGFGYYPYYRPSVVIVRPRDAGGRVLNGQGYRGPRRRTTGGSSSSPSVIRGGSSSGGGTISPAGPSSGGSSTGRKAKRRKGGGDDGGGTGLFH
ncbi:MAG: hypothetical protein GWM92_03570 [Gemmatimonadetes bacterium]|nr:hypothetical protein [Gemmatimonadota bacterium]NIR77599.1 hypothetical protein [Gemmatimonadota bacterium]NIT86154.1 hypothetical protein [Gemmatimonadota bacterium]NIU29968.1 hypothetical protein [Gemmatimonadota bacterium]NIU34933.1 hypothetical protein [Gemmatimonadota bacterium]